MYQSGNRVVPDNERGFGDVWRDHAGAGSVELGFGEVWGGVRTSYC